MCALCGQAMRVMNKRMNLPNMQKILMEFEKQNERMEMTSDMMGDAIDDAMEVREGAGWCWQLSMQQEHSDSTAQRKCQLVHNTPLSRMRMCRWLWCMPEMPKVVASL